MRGLLGVFAGFFGLLVFIWLLPALVWVFLVAMAIILIIVLYFRYKVRKAQKEFEKQFNEYETGAGNSGDYFYEEHTPFEERDPFFKDNYREHGPSSEVIDVEYEESEDFMDQERFR